MTSHFVTVLISVCGAGLPLQAQPANRVPDGPYQATWESLKKHKDPSWFLDAKLGIYTHWGPITVATENAPSDMEWYARQMYMPDHPAFKYHQQKFGDQHKVGYKDVIPHFTAEHFNADDWADLFSRAGAKTDPPSHRH